MRAAAEAGEGKAKAVKPVVIDDYQFKQDKEGYLTAASRTHLYLLDTRSGASEALTQDPQREDLNPAFSPDGRELAYVSHLSGGPAEAARDDLCLIGARPKQTPRRLLWTYSPNKQRLAWSPDGSLIAFLQGEEPKFTAYISDRLAVAEAKSGKVRALTDGLDRAVYGPRFAADGASILFSVEDDGYQYPAAVKLASGAIKHLAQKMVVHDLRRGARSHRGAGLQRHGTDRGLCARSGEAASPERAQRGALRRAQPRRGRGHRLQERRRHRVHGQSSSRPATRRAPLPDHPVDPRRPERPGRPLAGAVGYGRRSSGSCSPRTASWCSRSTIAAAAVAVHSTRAIAATGATRKSRPAGRSRLRGRAGHRGPRAPRHRRLELRRHPHRLHHRERHALQGGDQWRRQRQQIAMFGADEYVTQYKPSSGRPGATRRCG